MRLKRYIIDPLNPNAEMQVLEADMVTGKKRKFTEGLLLKSTRIISYEPGDQFKFKVPQIPDARKRFDPDWRPEAGPGWQAMVSSPEFGVLETWMVFQRETEKPGDPVRLAFFGDINNGDEYEVGGASRRPARTQVAVGHYASVGHQLPPCAFKLRFTDGGTRCIISPSNGDQKLSGSKAVEQGEWLPIRSGETIWYDDQQLVIEFPPLI